MSNSIAVAFAMSKLSNARIALLLISGGNLGLLAVAAFYPRNELTDDSVCPNLGILVAASSQVLYLIFCAAWLFEWMRFYPGNRIENSSILIGLALSGAALILAGFAGGWR